MVRQLLLFRFKNSVINPRRSGYILNLGVVRLCPARYGLTVGLVKVSKFRCTSVVTKQNTKQGQVMVIFNVPRRWRFRSERITVSAWQQYWPGNSSSGDNSSNGVTVAVVVTLVVVRIAAATGVTVAAVVWVGAAVVMVNTNCTFMCQALFQAVNSLSLYKNLVRQVLFCPRVTGEGTETQGSQNVELEFKLQVFGTEHTARPFTCHRGLSHHGDVFWAYGN